MSGLKTRTYPAGGATHMTTQATSRTNNLPLLIAGVVLTLAIAFLLLFRLTQAPRPWHDEGAALTLAQTLAHEGIYGVRVGDEIQTFGPVQSVGPTVILPAALALRAPGNPLFNARLVAVFYAAMTLALFFALAQRLFGYPTAFAAVLVLLASSTTRFLYQGRQVLGEVPAFGFFLGAWLLFLSAAGQGRQRRLTAIAAGMLLGAAIVTKSSYGVMAGALLALMLLLELVYYRLGLVWDLVVMGAVAGAIAVGWNLAQYLMFGPAVFQENLSKLSLLTQSTTGFHIETTKTGIQSLLGSNSDRFFWGWGIPALAYTAWGATARTRKAFVSAALLFFALAWLAFYLFVAEPWLSYIFVAGAITSLFTARLWVDIFTMIRSGPPLDAGGGPGRWSRLVAAGCFALALATVWGLTLVGVLRQDVMARDTMTPQIVAYLNTQVPDDARVETWERELAFLTSKRFHIPDQVTLAPALAASYRNATPQQLGAAYFAEANADYLVMGWFARWLDIYSPDYLADHAQLVQTIGDYQVYKLAPIAGGTP